VAPEARGPHGSPMARIGFWGKADGILGVAKFSKNNTITTGWCPPVISWFINPITIADRQLEYDPKESMDMD